MYTLINTSVLCLSLSSFLPSVSVPKCIHVLNGVYLSVSVLVFVRLSVSYHRFSDIQAYSSLWPTVLVGGG